jgi:hypothetical protein
MKTKLLIVSLICASCTTTFIKSENKVKKSDWIITEAYTKKTAQPLSIQGAKLKFLNDKVIVLSQNNDEIKGSWQIINNYGLDEYGSSYETLKIEIKDKNNQAIVTGQTSTFNKKEITLRGNIDGKTSIFKLKMVL